MNKKNILLVVEGEKTEKQFFQNYGQQLLGECNIDIIPFRCNIYTLYQFIKKYDFNIDIVDALIQLRKTNEQETKILKEKHFFSRYLIFDFDFQEKTLSFEEKIDRLQKMANHFNNESDNGLLFINYPMFESYQEEYASPPKTFPSPSKERYKSYIHKMKKTIDSSKLRYSDFCQLIKKSINIESYILHQGFDCLSYDDVMRLW